MSTTFHCAHKTAQTTSSSPRGALHPLIASTFPARFESNLAPDAPQPEPKRSSGSGQSLPGSPLPKFPGDPRRALGILHFGAAGSAASLAVLNGFSLFGPHMLPVALMGTVAWHVTLSHLQRASNEPGSPHARWHESLAYATALPPVVVRTVLFTCVALLSPTKMGAALFAAMPFAMGWAAWALRERQRSSTTPPAAPPGT